MGHDLDVTLKSAAILAQIMDAAIDFFSVMKPTDIVDKESQLSAIRTINKEQAHFNKKLKSVLDPYASEFGIDIQKKFTFGNVKNEIEDRIRQTKPDAIVIGKRKTNTFRFTGDKVADFVLNKYSGPVLIASGTNILEPKGNLSIGVLKSKESLSSESVLHELLERSTQPVKAFKIIEKGEGTKNNNVVSEDGIEEFVFEKNDNVVKNLSNYLIKSNVNLLCIERDGENAKKNKERPWSIKDIIHNINVPMLFTNEAGLSWN